MQHPLKKFRETAARLAAAHGPTAFQRDMAAELDVARRAFFDDPLLLRLRDDTLTFLYDDFGFGIEHSKNVAVDAAAIVLSETAQMERGASRRMAQLALLAGLLHDADRLEADGAARAADLSRSVLADYPLSDAERETVAQAIAAHEETAWTPPANPQEALLAGALYDADKFRYGADVYVTAMWEYCDYEDMPAFEAVRCLDLAAARLPSFEGAFRTRPGKLYGDRILAAGKDVLPLLTTELADFLAGSGPDHTLRIAKGRRAGS